MDEHLDRLLVELGERSNAEIAQIQSEGRAAVDTIRREAAMRVSQRRDRAIAACDAECADRRADAIAGARSRARATLLRAQHALVDRVIDRARAESSARFASACDSATLVTRTRELLTYIADDGTTVRCRPELADSLRASLPSMNVAADASADWGVRMSTHEDRLVVDDTLTTWFEREHPTLAMTICRRVTEAHA